VASLRALEAIAVRAQQQRLLQDLLIEVNVSGEQSKDGVQPAALPGLLERAAALPGLAVCGLMTMAPQGQPRVARATFAALRELRDSLASEFNAANADNAAGAALPPAASSAASPAASSISLRELSMGMSEDFELAIEEGATLVRIGRSVWLRANE
jgi:uncharacterized pyridoxal phosphate-containing UPF0001 family protein